MPALHQLDLWISEVFIKAGKSLPASLWITRQEKRGAFLWLTSNHDQKRALGMDFDVVYHIGGESSRCSSVQ